MCTLSIRISSLRACSAYASVRYMYDEGIQNKHMKNRKTDVCTEHTRKELMCNGDAESCWRPYSAGVHQCLTRFRTYKQKPGRGAGLREIETFRKVPLQVNFLDDDILHCLLLALKSKNLKKSLSKISAKIF